MWQVPRDRAGDAQAREGQVQAGWIVFDHWHARSVHVRSPRTMKAVYQSSQTYVSLQRSMCLNGKREEWGEGERKKEGKPYD